MGNPRHTQRCAACGKYKKRFEFSPSQWAHSMVELAEKVAAGEGRCRECVGSNRGGPRTESFLSDLNGHAVDSDDDLQAQPQLSL